jgi:RNA polymerase sigma-70 factor, ECF subfamily
MASFAFDIMEHLPRLKRYAAWLQRDMGEAEELVQETIAHALANARFYRHDRNLCGWLVTMMHNLHVNMIRARRRDPIFLPYDSVLVHGCAATQEAPVELCEIRRAVARLPRDQREALVLHWLLGLKYHEVAARLGIPHGTVLSRISRARTALRAMIAEPRSGLGLAHRGAPPRSADGHVRKLAAWPAVGEQTTSPYRVYADPLARSHAGAAVSPPAVSPLPTAGRAKAAGRRPAWS